MERNNIVVNDEYIVNFYKDNPNIDINDVNRVFISIIQNSAINLTDSITDINSQLISMLSKEIYPQVIDDIVPSKAE